MRRWLVVLAALGASLTACPSEAPLATPCDSSSQCPQGQVCQGSICVAGGCGGGCPDGQRCVASQCLPTACSNTPCGAGQVCVNSACTDEPCVGKTCEAAQMCVKGSCYPIDCPSDLCAEDSVCVTGLCVPKPCVDLHCASDEVCVAGDCIKATCSDATRDGTESDVDCGGSCPPCDEAKRCAVASDCLSARCTEGRCAAATPTCSDQERNGFETDVDCGGPCPSCAHRKRCISPGDCLSRVCAGGTCQAPTCSDSAFNGTETDVDCGGPCPGCSVGRRCEGAQDCITGVCHEETCSTAECTDGVRNGTETDLDCGGSCPSCADQRRCVYPGDCTSRVCASGTCQAPSCQDDTKNGSETDRDCGGGCPACADHRSCVQGADCASGACAGGRCQAPTCADQVKNGTETDQDCGGSCPRCANLKTCVQANDCASGWCIEGVCRELQEETCEPMFENDFANHVSYLLTRLYYISEDGSRVYASPCARSTASYAHETDTAGCEWVMDDAVMLGYQQGKTIIRTGAVAGNVIIRECSTIATLNYTFLGTTKEVGVYGPGSGSFTVPGGVTSMDWLLSAGGGGTPQACLGANTYMAPGKTGQAQVQYDFPVAAGGAFTFTVGSYGEASTMTYSEAGKPDQVWNMARPADPIWVLGTFNCPGRGTNTPGICTVCPAYVGSKAETKGLDGLIVTGHFGLNQPSDNPQGGTSGPSMYHAGGPSMPGGVGFGASGAGPFQGSEPGSCAGAVGTQGAFLIEFNLQVYTRPDGTQFVRRN
ncbi:MAG: hypothetical protein HY901_35485 [Deltaproteobacteria bacterium]|nr:hypothetical protein [Deltaproteobacteria bacterium]